MSQSGNGPAGNGSHSGVDGFPTPMINRRTGTVAKILRGDILSTIHQNCSN